MHYDNNSSEINRKNQSLPSMRNSLIFLLTLILISCSPGDNFCGDFNLNEVKDLIKLPSELKEISGITFLSKNKIACVQDEKGTVYVYDIHKDKLKESIDFGGNKDYEAIANVNDTIYVLRSNGDIYEIDDLESAGVTSINHHTFLSKVNNSEGMCYDSKHNRLLVACKGRPEKGSAKKYMKAVYSFDLMTKTMNKQPVLIMDPEQIVQMADQSTPKTHSLFGEEKRADQFDPAEIAIEPLTGNYFVLSSVGKRLAVFSPTGVLLCAVNLNQDIYKQPEGLAFSSTGDLVISDEGKNGKGNLVVVGRK